MRAFSFRIVLSQAHEHPNAPHPLALLRPRRERPPCSCAAEQRDELAAPHSITSSAWASNVGEIVKHIDSAAREGKKMLCRGVSGAVSGAV